jgi:hypothetical protein
MSAGREVPGRVLAVKGAGADPAVLLVEVERPGGGGDVLAAPLAQSGRESPERWAGRRVRLTYRVSERGVVAVALREVAP